MNIEQSYNLWAHQYDADENRTRDLEAVALREMLQHFHCSSCLEIGCGTGKNTQWLLHHATTVTCIDLSGEMLAKARAKISSDAVHFIQADITQQWNFSGGPYDLVVFSLVLEHIENLTELFQKVKAVIAAKSFVYIGELHPFKQYNGTKARFNTAEGQQIVTCYNHHLSDFTDAAQCYGFEISIIKEYFDNGDRTAVPRILSLLLTRKMQ
jgi:ubiquinone/menaquinone biosynthesis C-methylase UbiE